MFFFFFKNLWRDFRPDISKNNEEEGKLEEIITKGETPPPRPPSQPQKIISFQKFILGDPHNLHLT